jgi:hypothetical protein
MEHLGRVRWGVWFGLMCVGLVMLHCDGGRAPIGAHVRRTRNVSIWRGVKGEFVFRAAWREAATARGSRKKPYKNRATKKRRQKRTQK